MDVTSLLWNRPAGAQSMSVRNIGQTLPSSQWRSLRPASTSGSSKEKEQPSAKTTKSSRQRSSMLTTSPSYSPSRNTR